MEGKTPYRRHELVKWTYSEFYTSFVYYIRVEKANERYNELRSNK